MLKAITEQVLLPQVGAIIDKLTNQANEYRDVAMMCRTHGQ